MKKIPLRLWNAMRIHEKHQKNRRVAPVLDIAPSILIDLVANTATVNGVSTPITNLLAAARADSRPTIDASGVWGSVGANTLARSSAGLSICQGATNLWLYSQTFVSAATASNGVTITDNVDVAPDGTTTAATIACNGVSGTHFFQQNQALTVGNVYTFSGRFKWKSGSARYIQLFCGGGTPDAYYATLDTQTGAVNSPAGVGLCRARSRPLANGWYQFEVTFAVKGTQTAYGLAVVPSGGSTRAATSSLTGVINVWGFQINPGYVALPYTVTTSAAASRAADVITMTGALASALSSGQGTVVITTGRSVNGQASTLIGSDGTVMLGKTALNGCRTMLGSTLSAPTAASNWETDDNTVSFGWDASGGVLQLAGGSAKSDATARAPGGTFYLGSTGGASAFHNGVIKSITFYPAKRTFDVTAATPLRSFDAMKNYAGNPIIPYNTTAYNTVAADGPYFNKSQKVGNTYYALAQGNNGPGSKWQNILVYSVSPDFQTFNPVGLAWSATASGWDDHYIGHPAGAINVGGTWYVPYSGMNSAGTLENVGIAYSTDFVSWTKYASNPVITDNVAIPCMIQIGSTFFMYAANRPTGNTISYYTAPHPLGPWVRGGTAISTLAGDWHQGTSRLNDPNIVLNPQGFYEMTYTIENSGATPYTFQAFGYAVSTDGINWTKLQAPILQGDGIIGSANNKYPGDSQLFFNGDSVWLYWAGVNSSSLAQGCLAKIVP